VFRDLLLVGAGCCAFFLGFTARAAEGTDSGLPVVAPESQLGFESEVEPPPHPNDERWLNKPFYVGLSTIIGLPQGMAPFWMPGGELGYALPYVSFAGTLGYFDGLNASLAVRGRLHLGHAVALTLGPRGALLPLEEEGCFFTFAEGCDEKPRTSIAHAFFGGGELGVEGRTEAGLMWGARMGLWGLLAHRGGTCTSLGSASACSVESPQPGVVYTQEVTMGWAF
jgi:hypothetical protein